MTHIPTELAIWERSQRRCPPEKVQISVIIPTLQEERTLKSLLERFDDATIERYGIEVVVSDGGSSDQTVAIAQRYADVVAMHRAHRRQTIAEGRNVGAYLSHGETLVFLNADCMPADWERFWHAVAQWASGGGPYATYAALAAPVEVLPAERQWSDTIVHSMFNAYIIAAARLGFGVGRGECHLVRRWLFERIGGYAASLAAGEDFEFLHRARQWSRIGIPQELLVYESPRRYRRWGYPRLLGQWFLNWVGAMFLRRSMVREWSPVRESEPQSR
ncbi:MAG: hypothetical protein KatS3mg039_0425 [Candidatus Kapaibacterium sp.]|nr:MAG: hypothetical protein KatS3mg039_0425 [Candidatus Kapabacteria bacterium]